MHRRDAWHRLIVLGFSLGLWGSHSINPAAADELSSAIYVRTDEDDTTVVAPRVRAAKDLSTATRVDALYTADVWTSASIDIRASASVRPVTEQRDEIGLNLSHSLDDTALRGGYRFSTEPDYTSHGGTASLSRSFANNAATLDAAARVFADTVGRAGDPDFERGLVTASGRLSLTQVIDPLSFAQLTYEIAHLNGFQASPYRWVGIATTRYGCIGASLCVAERVPDQRTRHAVALNARRALSDAMSIGAGYRVYADDWALTSHTFEGDLGLSLGARSVLHARYRYYRQSATEFYERRYESMPRDGYRTRDRELSEFDYHRAGLELEYAIPLGGDAGALSLSALAGGTVYDYDDFLGLDEVMALELTGALSIVL